MYYVLTNQLKVLLIETLRDYWASHPGYPDLASCIQGKYSFKERPQYGMVVKVGSANKVQLSAQNYLGIQQSYVMLAKIPGYRGDSLEWVLEDSAAIRAGGGSFPTLPGVYYGVVQPDLRLTLDPLLEVRAEPLVLVDRQEALLQQPAYGGSLRLYELPSQRLLRPERDYTLAADQVTVRLMQPLPAGLGLVADYRYPGPQLGPWAVQPERAYPGLLPGCVLCFGRRLAVGDRFALVVTQEREDAYEEYGGKWELSVDVDVLARDVHAQTEIADATAMFLLTRVRPMFSERGVELTDVSLSGESEEVYDENADDYYYNTTFSLSVETEWLMFAPLLPRILSHEETLRQMPPGLHLEGFRDPYFSLRATYPTVG